MTPIMIGKAWEPEEIVSTGSLLLDSCFKFGGIPTGSIIHYYSPPEHEGSHKTTLGMCGIAQLQAAGYKVGGIDTELTPWDQQWLEGKGLKITKKQWVYSRPTSGEQAISEMVEMVTEYKCKGILFDSIEHARPTSYRESDPGDANTGSHAKLMRQFWQHCKDLAEKYNTTFYVINNSKAKLGFMPWEKGETIAGGQGSTYAPTVNVRMRRPSDSSIKNTTLIPIKVQVKRSKIGGSWSKFETYFYEGLGVDRPIELMQLNDMIGTFKMPTSKRNAQWEGESIGSKKIIECREWAIENEKLLVDALKNDPKTKHLVGL